MPLLNYSTTVSVQRSAAEVQAMLVAAGATSIMMDYDGQRNITGLSFRVETPHGLLPFKVPVRGGECQKVLERQHKSGNRVSRGQTTYEHAQRVAWRILKDWTEAQIALIETSMVSLEEIFLPYMLTGGGLTLYDRMLESGFKALPEGRQA